MSLLTLTTTTESEHCSHDHAAVYQLVENETTRWGIRNDVRRNFLYERSKDTGELVRGGILHPIEAIALALNDGTRSLDMVETELMHLFDLDRHTACANIEALLKRRADALSRLNGSASVANNRYNPRDFIIPAHLIDLETARLYKPIGLSFHLSDDCMRNCIYCNIERRKRRDTQELTRKRWVELFRECIDLDILTITLSGGDPFMNKDIVEFISLLTQAGIQPLTATKSRVSKEVARRLKEAGLQRIQVSIDAASYGLGDLMTGSPGAFESAIESIRNLLDAGMTVRSNCVMTRVNVGQAPALVNLLLGMGVDTISLTGFGRSLYVDPNLNDLLFLSQEEKDSLEALARSYTDGTVRASLGVDWSTSTPESRWESFPHRSMCSAGRWGFIIHSDGKVTLCDEMPLNDWNVVGDVTHQSILEVWQSPRIDQLLNPPMEQFKDTACADCADFTECANAPGRCFRDAQKSFGTYFAPSPNCPRAPIGLRQT